MTVDTSFIPDLPKGPLCVYRNRSKFDWKYLRIIFEEEGALRIKYKLWKIIENDPLFAKSKSTLSADKQKHLAAMQMNHMVNLDIIPNNLSFRERCKYLLTASEAVHAICPNLAVKAGLSLGLFNNTLTAMGTKRHEKYHKAASNREVVFCLAVTEVSHGSNTKSIRTTATYDPKNQEFIIHTPDFEAAKCWVGNLGKTATIALTFANLITPDGTNHGLHGFLVPVRNPKTLLAYRGVMVGDIGEKIGLNGVDNGFVMFTNYRIPKENLLNRTGDVTPDGNYESVFTEPGKILGAALASFSAGRLGIMQSSCNTLSNAAVISVRYAAIRKQFAAERNGAETPIIEYQLHQWRIFPYLAAACILKISVVTLTNSYLDTLAKSQKDSNGFELLSQTVTEMHAVISSSKPLFTWTARDAIQEAREACGGHGYLKAANIGELRNNHDPSCTYEGDNNVLSQQTSNWLLRQWEEQLESPAGTANFILQRETILRLTFGDVVRRYPLGSVDFVIQCYEWLLCYLLKKTSDKKKKMFEHGKSRFDARNNSQVYGARDLARAYPEYYALCSFRKRFEQPDVTPNIKEALLIVYLVYGYWSIDRHLASFCEGGFALRSNFVDTIREELLRKCSELKEFAVSIADALAPPDFALNSVLAKSDGLLYKHLQNEFMTNEGALERPKWWKDVIQSKL